MKITIEPTEQRRVEPVDTMHSTVSISIASDDLDITETMGQVVKALQGWGFHNESIAKELDYELAWQLGLRKELPFSGHDHDGVFDMDKTKFEVGDLHDGNV